MPWSGTGWATYLMDDPISALDARLHKETRIELKRIQRELGHTLIYVTRDQEEAMSVADRMAILEGGKIRQVGAPAEIYDRPASIYVARLLGSPSMNILNVAHGVNGVEAADGAIRVPPERAPRDAAEIGIRPENLRVEPWEPGLRGKPNIRPEAKVALSCDPARMHFFSAGGKALA